MHAPKHYSLSRAKKCTESLHQASLKAVRSSDGHLHLWSEAKVGKLARCYLSGARLASPMLRALRELF